MSNVSKRLSEILGSKTPELLEDIYEIEDVALYIKFIDEKIDFYKLYKKKKKRDIDTEIGSLTEKKQFLKKVILKTIKDSGKKSFNFPGSCMVKTSKGQNKWTIKDEEAFIKFLEKNNEKDRCVEEVTDKKIIKKEANKFLNTCDGIGKVPACVDKEDAEGVVSITYFEEKEDNKSEDIPVKKEIDYDELDFSN